MNRLQAAARRPRAYAVALLGVVLIGSLLGAEAASQADVVLGGVSVGGIPVAGLDSAEVIARLEVPAHAIERRQITLVAGDRSWRVSPLDLGIGVDVRRTADEAFKAGREDVAQWVSRTFGGGERRLSWVPSVNRARFDSALDQLSHRVNLDANNGEVRFEGPNVVVRPPIEGVSLLKRPAATRLLQGAM
ncbi:MAG: peptidoglycan binding domain-containing protein, partial [Anaerolineales bacterium]